MNKRIKNYVETLFSQIPYSRKAQDMKDEISADLEAHFNDNLLQGMSEDEAFSRAVDSLGDMDEVLNKLVPEKDLQEKINAYRQKRAKTTAIAIALYIIGVAALIFLSSFGALWGYDVAKLSIIGVVSMFVFVAIATALLIYNRMSIPQEVIPFIKPKNADLNIDTSTRNGRILKTYMESHTIFFVVLYFLISFSTGAWHITWLVFLIDVALTNAVKNMLND